MNHPYDTVTDFSFIQTFFVDPDVVNSSGEISLTSVDLYFKNKPKPTKNSSGKTDPGVLVRICELTNNEPDLTKVIFGYTSYRTYDNIYSFSDASSPTTFGFSAPMKLRSGRYYGIVITLEDASYELWTNKTGDRLVGTSTVSSGSSSVKDGKLYLKNTANQFNALSDTDLKFNINCAQYTANTLSEVFVNKEYEFFTLNNITGRFLGGEYVWQTTANATGTIAVTANTRVIRGTNTTFDTTVTAGDRLVVHSNSTYQQMLTVLNVVNSTYLETSTLIAHSNTSTNYMLPPSGKVHNFDRVLKKLFLVESNANSTLFFAANTNSVTGEDSRAVANLTSIDVHSVDRVRLKADFTTPAAGVVNNSIAFAAYNGSTYGYSASNREPISLNIQEMFNVTQYDAHILSRSIEVTNAGLASNTDLLFSNKSVTVNTDIGIKVSNTELYQSPTIESDQLDMFVFQNFISNTYTTTDANTVTIDTEVYGPGVALSKHVSKKVRFANNRFAEDVRVYMNAYRPAGTELRVYARIHNSTDAEAFDDKAWTPLTYIENGERYSSRDDETDIVEYTLGLPQYSESANVLPGTFTTQLANSVIVAAGVNPTTYVATNDVIKLYNPLIPEDYIVGVVSAANTTSITLGTAIANNNVVGAGFAVDRLKYYNTAFNNMTNDNVARYYSSTLVEHDTFDSMQYKIVMLADTTYKVPKVDSVTFIGVSA